MRHEIQTPMTSIIGFAKTLTDSDARYRERADASHAILDSAKHLMEPINEILDLYKAEAANPSLPKVIQRTSGEIGFANSAAMKRTCC